MTTLDLSKISSNARERYIRIGRRYGSNDTLQQAHLTLNALDTHASSLVDCGFGPDDVAMLAEARDALSTATSGRESKALETKVTRKEYLAAVTRAKSARRKARTILQNTLVLLENDGKDESAHNVESVLTQTSALPAAGHDEAFAAQLDGLAAALTDPAVADASSNRGGGKALAEVQDAASALRAAAEDREHGGTRLSTEEMDLLDGLIVTSCRAARNAAKQAARDLGTPALLAAFALRHIEYDAGHATKTPVTPPTTP